MKSLVGIPVVTNLALLERTVDSCKTAGFNDFIFINNGASTDIIEYTANYPHLTNETNIGVNRAWNQILSIFIKTDYDSVIIANSDIELKSDYLDEWNKIDEDRVFIFPNIVKKFKRFPLNLTDDVEGLSGGVFMTLNRQQVDIVYPIQTKTNIWFGDSDILQRLRKAKYRPMLYFNMQLKHEESATINSLDLSNNWHDENKVWLNEIKYDPRRTQKSIV